MKHQIAEVQIAPVKPSSGLVAFASLILDGDLYLGSIAVHTKPDGRYRLVYPTREVSGRKFDVFHPINREAGEEIEKAVITRLEEVMNYGAIRESETNIQAL